MNDALTRRYPLTVKPRHWEDEASYTTRLLAANAENDTHLRHLIRLAQQHNPAADRRDVLVAKTGRTFHFGNLHGTTDADGHCCDHCPDAGRLRPMCTLCSEGETVLQAAPFASPVCIRHRRWVGVAGNVRQTFVNDETVQAAIRFEKLRRARRLTPALYDVLAAATRTATHTGTDLMTVVKVAAAITTKPFVRAMFGPDTSYAGSHAVLDAAVTKVAPTSAGVVRALWSYFRPSFWALRHAVITDAAYVAGWEHDFIVPADIAADYIAKHSVVPFAQFADAAAPGTPKTALPAVLGRGGQVICEHGHPHQTRRSCPVCNHTEVLAGYNDLATTHPDIAAELDPVMNGATTGRTVAAASHRSLAWRCPRARHVYWATPSNRTQTNSKCGICSNRTVVPGINDLTTTHPRLAAEVHPDFAIGHPPAKMLATSGDRPEWLCPDCGHRYNISLYNRSQGGGCDPCRRARLRAERGALADTHPDIAAQWHPTRNNGTTPYDVTHGSNENAYWLCQEDAAHWYPQRIDRKVAGYGCSLCARRRVVTRVNDLATTDPLLITEFHTYLNAPKSPERMLAGTDLHWWKCSFGHVKQQSVPNRRKSKGCTDCLPEDRILAN
jgi:hypothetical protein